MSGVPYNCTCGFGCGTETALRKHLERFATSHGHARSSGTTATNVTVQLSTSAKTVPESLPKSHNGNHSDLHKLKNEVEATSAAPDGDSVCRFCLDRGEEVLLTVCGCRGSGKWVHGSCIRKWMASAQTLVNHPSEIATEQRHVICSVCHEHFHGVQPPSRLELVGELARFEPRDLSEGIMLRYANVFPVPESEDPSTMFMVENKRKHFESSVYLVFASERNVNADGDAGDDAILGVNLTRSAEIAWGTEETCALEVRTRGNLSDQQIEAWRSRGLHVELSLGGPIKPAKIATAMLISGKTQQIWAMGDAEALVARVVDAGPKLNSGKPQLRIFLGHARWTRSQLLGEIARGSWGVAQGRAQASQLRAAHCHCRSSEGLWWRLETDQQLHWAPSNPMRDDYYRRAQRPPER